MKICIISALTMADFNNPDLSLAATSRDSTPQLGVLCIAAALIERGFGPPNIINLDQCFIDFLREQKAGAATTDFFASINQHLRSTSADVFAFSTICSSYPLTLRLAREVKRFHPESAIIFGGPQASVVDEATMQTFEFVDFVVRGEADHSFPDLLSVLSPRDPSATVESIPGVTYRMGSRIVRNSNAAAIANLDSLPLPAFHLDPYIDQRRNLHLEIGRGCPFACTFCSTNDFFRRNFRLKSTAKMVEQMQFLRKTYGVSNFSLVHDMYTVNRKKVVEFCEALLKCKETFTWSCSARTDCVDDELIGLMAKAGCEGIFFGIETGSPRLQKIVAKNLDLAEATNRIRCAADHRITTAVALITGFPEERREDLRQTIHYFVDSLRFGFAEPQLSLLAPLAKTPIHRLHQDKLELDYIFSDMSHQGWRQDEAEIEMIRRDPEIFPNFYAAPTLHLNRSYFKEVRDFTVAITTWFWWLPVVLLQDSGDLLALFDDWKAWQSNHFGSSTSANSQLTPYHYRRDFPEQFLNYAQSRYVKQLARAGHAILAIAETEARLQSRKITGYGTTPANCKTERTVEVFSMKTFPCWPEGLDIIESNIDYKELLRCLRNKGDMALVSLRKTTVAFKQIHPKQVEVRQLTRLSSELLQMCDGQTPVKRIIKRWRDSGLRIKGINSDKVCVAGLRRLREQGLLYFSPNSLLTKSLSADSV